MKKITTLFAMMICAVIMMANPVEPEQASTVALHFMMRQMPAVTRSTECTLAYTKSNDRSDALFYVYNVGGGFVIVSADDAVTPVLGYSTTGSFDPQNIPANCAAWLQGYADQIAIVKEHNLSAPTKVSTEWIELAEGREPVRSGNTRAVAPLLTTTWSQYPWYNELCPGEGDEHAVTGCVATAMAQIINYHQWPAQGFGTHRYNEDDFGMLQSDFGNTTYRYDLMPDELDENSTSEQVNAVATLMRDCGVAVNMDYGIAGSAAYDHDARVALVNYFGYNTEIAEKDWRWEGTVAGTWNTEMNYSDNAWKNLLKQELDAHNPIYYSGVPYHYTSDMAGHALVCDGYDANDYFHFNWGWGGSCDGFYAIGEVTPDDADAFDWPWNNVAIFCHPNTSGTQKYLFRGYEETATSSTMTVSGTLDLSHSLAYNEDYEVFLWGWDYDTLTLYPQSADGQLFLEKLAYDASLTNMLTINVYDGEGTDGTLLMTVNSSEEVAPVFSTTGALTLVSEGNAETTHELLLRVSEVNCMPFVNGFTCARKTFSTADFVWNIVGAEEWTEHDFNFQIEYGPHGFTPGTGTTVAASSTSLAIGGLTNDTEYDAYLTYTCTDGVQTLGPVTFQTEEVMVNCFEEPIVPATGWNSDPFAFCIGFGTEYHQSQQIYTAAELAAMGLHAGDEISSLAVQFVSEAFNGSNIQKIRNIAIYMGNTPRTTFEDITDIFALENLVNVYIEKEHIYDHLTALEWHEFEFDNLFVWDGHSNVVVAFADHGQVLGNYANIATNIGVEYNTFYTTRAYDPLLEDYRTEYVLTDERASIRLCMATRCPKPTHLTSTYVNRHSVQIEWLPGYQETTWNVEYGPAGFEQGTGTSRTIDGEPQLILTQLTSEPYDIYVQADCGDATSQWVKYTFFVGDYDCVQIGELPNENYYQSMPFIHYSSSGYCFSEQMFTAEELSEQGLHNGDNIVSISLDCQSRVPRTISNVCIYLCQTTDTYFSRWKQTSEMQLVFSGDVEISNGPSTIYFDAPFTWNDTSNLVVAIWDNSGELYNGPGFASHPSNLRSIRTYSANPIDTVRLYTYNVESGHYVEYRNNIRFCKNNLCVLQRDINISIAEGATYDFYGTTITDPGTYYRRWFVNDECDSLVVLHLSVRKVFFVTPNGSGSHDGSSWANAMQLQEAMDTCSYFIDRSPCLYVKKGTYTGNVEAENSFEIMPNVHAYGGFVGNEPADYDLSNRTQANMDQTILFGSNARRVLYQNTDFTPFNSSLFDGFTIRGGTASTNYNGGGAYIRKNCTLNNCKITANTAEITSDIPNSTAYYGIGVYSNGGTLTNCEIYNNTVNLSGTGSGYTVNGVGVYMTNNGVVENCNIHENTAINSTGNNWNVYGGGVACIETSTISHCTVTQNSATLGGGISCRDHSTITNCIISNNIARAAGGAVTIGYGGAVFTQCLISNNAAGSSGGGVNNAGTPTQFIACDIVRNSAVTSGAGLYTNNDIFVYNSIVWGNKVGANDNQLAASNGRYYTFENSAVQGGYSGAITLEADNTGTGVGYPHFTSPTTEAGVDVYNAIGDWILQPGSICANLGRNYYVNRHSLNTDLGGNTRIQQGRADIGCYESAHEMAFPIHPETEHNIIYVTTTGAGMQDGSSWDNATDNLQYAMDMAMGCNPPAAVWVAEGTYTPSRPLIAQPKVAVYGGFEGVEPSTFDINQRNLEEHATIIDGDSTHRVLDKSRPFDGTLNPTYLPESSIILMPTTGTLDITACSGTIYDNGGETGNYYNCNGNIILHSFNPNSNITLTGTYHIDYVNGRDKLYIYDYNEGILLGTFYDEGSISLTYPTSAIILEFTSTGYYSDPGFAINFTFSDCAPASPEQNDISFQTGKSLFNGLTFQNGFVSGTSDYAGAYLYANTDLLNCTFSNNHRNGVYATDCHIDNCVFDSNKGTGLYTAGATDVNNCTAQNNTNYGIYFTSTGTLTNSMMKENNTSGLYITNGKVDGCTIQNNGASNYGVNSRGTNIQFSNTSIINNLGGGLYAEGGFYVNVNIANNTKTRTGTSSNAVYAGVHARSNARFINCNIVNNKVELVPSYVGGSVNYTNAYAGIFNYSTNNEYTNCIVWGNRADTLVSNLQGEGTFSYCAVEEGVDGIANITLESDNAGETEEANYVNFVRPSDEAGITTQDTVDYHLAAGSACINAGNSNNTSLQLPTYDLGGSLRIKQQRVDIGVYESGDVTTQHIDDEVCLGESYFYGNYFVFPEEIGLHTDTFIYYQGGNDYIAYINLQVNPVYNINIDTVICAGESYYFNGQTYTTSTTATASFLTAKGCDSTVVLNLTVTPSLYGEFSAVACDSYIWNGIPYYESGDYEQTLQAETGCDSIVTLHLTVHHSVETVDSMTLCRAMLPFVYRNVIINENAPEHDTIPFILATSHGCDSTVYMRFTIVDVITTEFSDEACDFYVWNDVPYTTGGDKEQTFLSSNGCDSIVTLHLTLHHTNGYEFEAEACYSYTWNDQTYTESGDYQQVLTNNNGCDSVVTLHLTIFTSSEYAFSDEACDQYVWNDQVYTESGDYQQSFTNAAGCDSIVTLHLTIYPTYQTQLEETICQGDLPYHYTNGLIDTTFDENTPELSVFNFQFSTSHGCDSTVTLTLHVTPVTTPQLVVDGYITACQSSSATLSVEGNYTSYNWSTGSTTPSITVTTPGYYYVELIDVNGCASISEVNQLGVSTLIPETPAICMVGVENGHNLIVWEELENPNVQNYRVYRENEQANIYELLATVPASQGNSYEDVTADPTVRAWRYKVTAMDVCQGETPMSELHKTVHLTINQGVGNTWNLIWTHYEGMEFASYRLYRGTTNADLQQIATLPATLTSYTDYDNVDGALFYQIEVVMNGTCLRRSETYTGARSNIVYNGERVYTDTSVTACQHYEWLSGDLTASGDYDYSYTSELGYDVTATLHLTIVTPPVFTISGNTTIAAGSSTTLSVPNNPQWTYEWSTGETTNSITVSPTETTTYYVTVTKEPCEATALVVVTVTNGINEYGTTDVRFYPNPTTGMVNVQFTMNNEQCGDAEIQVLDVYGRLLNVVGISDARGASLQTTSIDLSQYATGIYILKVMSGSKVVAIGKVVKE